MKFKVGDKVKFSNSPDFGDKELGFFNGLLGKVTDIFVDVVSNDIDVYMVEWEKIGSYTSYAEEMDLVK